MNEIPQELNWVQVRAACSLAKVFTSLHDGVVVDVAEVNTVRGETRRPFEVIASKEAFTVRLQETLKPVVEFSLEAGHILVGGDQFTVGLNNEGRCVLKHNGKEYEQWQIRKTALESLFFPTN